MKKNRQEAIALSRHWIDKLEAVAEVRKRLGLPVASDILQIQIVISMAQFVMEERLTPNTVGDFVQAQIDRYAQRTQDELARTTMRLGPRTKTNLKYALDRARRKA